ncbi:MAG: hypothetical protein ACLU4N_16035 [Butyricimonas faecihominis]
MTKLRRLKIDLKTWIATESPGFVRVAILNFKLKAMNEKEMLRKDGKDGS